MGAVNNIHTHLDLNSNEIRDVRLEHLESDPAAASGRVYYNSKTREVRYSDGEKWGSLNVGIWSIDEDGNIVASGDVIIDGNLVIKRDTASGGKGQDTPAPGIQGIRVNGTLYEDDNNDGIIDLGVISGGDVDVDLTDYVTKQELAAVATSGKYSDLSDLPTLGSLASKDSLAVTDIPDLSSKYLSLGGGTLDANSTIKWTHSTEENWNNAVKGLKILRYASTSNVSPNGSFANYASGLHIASGSTYGFQIGYNAGYSDNNYIASLRYRGYSPNKSAWGAWKQIAFTDSTVKAANRLASKVSLWGNDFDGSEGLSGSLTIGDSTNKALVSSSVVTFQTTATTHWNRGLLIQAYDDSKNAYATMCRIAAYGAGTNVNFAYIGTGWESDEIWVKFSPTKTTFNGDVTINGNLIVRGDTSSGGSGQVNPGGGIDEEELEKYLADYVNEIITSGSGNVVSSVSKSGKKITFTKGVTALTSITSSRVTSALGYTPYNSANFTKANIKSTLGISDWALAASKPSYTYSEVGVTKSVITDLIGTTTYAAYNANGYLPLNGGTLKNSTYSTVLKIDGATNALMDFLSAGTKVGSFGMKSDGTLVTTSAKGTTVYNIIHSANIKDYNAGTATKLKTERTIWGQPFDGSASIENQHLVIYKNPSGTTGAWVRGMRAMSSTDSTLATFAFHGSGDTLTKAYIGNSYTSPWVSILPSGNVGIGTDSPSYALDVVGRIQTQHTSNPYVRLTSDSYNAFVQLLSSGDVAIGKSSALGLHVAQSGAVSTDYGVTAKTFTVGSTTGEAHIIFSRTTANYLTAPEGGTIRFVTNGKAVSIANSDLSISNGAVQVKGTFEATTSVTTPIVMSASGAGLGLQAQGGGSAAKVWLNTNMFRPYTADAGLIDLGSSTIQWRNVYAINAIISGDSASGSDVRFKDIVEDKALRIEDIANAPCFTFRWNDREDKSLHLGTSAQYWEKITPELIFGDEFKTLNYASLGVAMGISLAKKAMNHEERIKQLEKQVETLKEENRRLRNGQIC